jgi:hypothetical protein
MSFLKIVCQLFYNDEFWGENNSFIIYLNFAFLIVCHKFLVQISPYYNHVSVPIL